MFGAVFAVQAQFSFSTLRQLDGFNGYADTGIMQGTDGTLYLACSGGTGDAGVIYRIDPLGNTIETKINLGSETATNSPMTPLNPYRLFQGQDGYIYGASSGGGQVSRWTGPGAEIGSGTIFRMNPDGSGLTNVFQPFLKIHALALGSDQYFYGSYYDTNTFGTALFRVRMDGSDFEQISPFVFEEIIDAPLSEIDLSSDGSIYWADPSTGTNAAGELYRVNKDGSNFTVLHEFGGDTNNFEAYPRVVVDGPDNRLYGTASYGVGYELYSVNKDGTDYKIIATNLLTPSVIMTNGWIYSQAESSPPWWNSSIVRFHLDGGDNTVLATNSPPEFLLPDDQGPTLITGTDGAIYELDEGGGVYRFKDFTSQDFDHFNTGDWIFQNAKNQLEVWFMDGTNKLGTATCRGVHPTMTDQRFVGMEELANNQSAIIWQEQSFGLIWASIFKGTNFARNELLYPKLGENGQGPEFTFVHAPFSSQSKGLIVQQANGTVAMWLTNDANIATEHGWNYQHIYSTQLPSYLYAGALTDCNNDGHPDLMLQDANGAMTIWYIWMV